MPGTLLFTNATIVTLGENPEVIRDGAVWIENGKIRGFGSSAEVLAAVWCPLCWSVVRYIGGGAYSCRAHGEVVPIGLENILPQILEAAMAMRKEQG